MASKKKNSKKVFLKRIGGKRPPSFWSHIVTVILIVMAVILIFSFAGSYSQERTTVGLTELALAVKEGKVSSILVEGNDLQADYIDGTLVVSKKEMDASLTETLINYGVTGEELGNIKIDIKKESGFIY